MLNDLIFPKRCLGCSRLGEWMCPLCLRTWKYENLLTHVGGLQVYSSVLYSPIASRVLLAAKEDSIRIADDFVILALRLSIARARKEFGLGAILVPIPSQRHAIRVRGRNFTDEIVHKAARHEGNQVRQLLTHQRRVKDQSALDASSRRVNLREALTCTGNISPSREVILADDLVTTGSTLLEAVRALSLGNIAVLAAVTACVAQPLR
jgi:predicted amidophosphoribosyltransferase